MKILCSLFFILILSCSEQDAHPLDLRERDGLIYLVGSDIPFTGREISRWSGGQVAGSRHFKDGKLHGASLQYQKDGTLDTEMNFKDGILHGLYHLNQGERGYAEGVYENGVLNGAKSYYHSGAIYGEEGDEPGQFIEYYESGSIMSVWNRDDIGYLFGEEIFYYENGQMKSYGNYRGIEGKDGLFTTWDEDGNVTSEIEYHKDTVVPQIEE